MAMRIIVVAGSLISVAALTSRTLVDTANCGGSLPRFAEFVGQFGRTYEVGSKEYVQRETIFDQRTAEVRTHNCDSERPWNAGINHLSDWTEAELQGLLGHKSARHQQAATLHDRPMFATMRSSVSRTAFPEEFSWRNLSSIQETWDQGNCGSCWAVAATSVMRAHAEIKGLNRQFSADQVIACTPNPNACGGTGGCDGATAELAYEYVLRAGVERGDDAFRKIGGMPDTCPVEKRVSTEKTTEAILDVDGTEVHRLPSGDRDMRGRDLGMIGWNKLAENKENPILHALVEQGPLYIAVAAGGSWFSYMGGVLTPSGCDAKNVVNHAVVLYGFGIKPHTRIGDVKYWHIKNSWGPNWGEEGSIRLQRLDEEEKYCGWDASPQEGSGCKGGPPKVWVCGSCGILYDAVVPVFASS